MTIRATFASPESRRHAIAARWPALTDEDIRIADNDREALVVRIVDRYGISAEWADRQVAAWETEVGQSKAGD